MAIVKQLNIGDVILLSRCCDCVDCNEDHSTTRIVSRIVSNKDEDMYFHRILSVFPEKFANDNAHWPIGEKFSLNIRDWGELRILTEEEAVIWEL